MKTKYFVLSSKKKMDFFVISCLGRVRGLGFEEVLEHVSDAREGG